MGFCPEKRFLKIIENKNVFQMTFEGLSIGTTIDYVWRFWNFRVFLLKGGPLSWKNPKFSKPSNIVNSGTNRKPFKSYLEKIWAKVILANHAFELSSSIRTKKSSNWTFWSSYRTWEFANRGAPKLSLRRVLCQNMLKWPLKSLFFKNKIILCF